MGESILSARARKCQTSRVISYNSVTVECVGYFPDGFIIYVGQRKKQAWVTLSKVCGKVFIGQHSKWPPTTI